MSISLFLLLCSLLAADNVDLSTVKVVGLSDDVLYLKIKNESAISTQSTVLNNWRLNAALGALGDNKKLNATSFPQIKQVLHFRILESYFVRVENEWIAAKKRPGQEKGKNKGVKNYE